jgi:N4-gp56 family major capsid protein
MGEMIKYLIVGTVSVFGGAGRTGDGTMTYGTDGSKAGGSKSGDNNITFFYDRSGIKAFTEENRFEQLASKKYMKAKHGKEYRISRWFHIMDWENSPFTSGDADGELTNVTVRKPDGTQVTVYGVNYGGSRNIADMSASGMPTLAEGAGRVNKVGVERTTINATIHRFGNFLEYTDEVDLFSDAQNQIHFREELGYTAGQVKDDLIQRDILNGSTHWFFGGGKNAENEIEAGHFISTATIKDISKFLTKAKAKRKTSIISGTSKIGTAPVKAGWYAVCGTDMMYNLLDNPDFQPVEKYPEPSKAAKGEFGSLWDVRFVHNPRMFYKAKEDVASAGDNQVDVHYAIIMGDDAFATLTLRGKGGIVFRAIPPENKELGNPYGTRGLFSYNFWHATIVLRPEHLVTLAAAVE